MKRQFIISIALLVCGVLQAQTLESICWDFEEDYEAGNILEWTTIDADGDGHCWQLHPTGGMAHNDTDGMVVSYSKDLATNEPLTPSNYLVSPRLTLGFGSCIGLWAHLLDESCSAEHWAVCVSTTVNDDPMAFTTLYEWTFDVDPFQPGAWRGYYVDLSQYAGQDVYIAIRHYWSSGNSAICIDDICLEWVSWGVEETTQSVSVYPNPAKDNVKIEGINPATVQIYNTLGQMVKNVEDTNEISVAGLPEGVYLLRVRDKLGVMFTERISVIK